MAKDPVCGMLVNEAKEKKSDYKDQTYYFCSDYCQRLFEKAPEKGSMRSPVEATTYCDSGSPQHLYIVKTKLVE